MGNYIPSKTEANSRQNLATGKSGSKSYEHRINYNDVLIQTVHITLSTEMLFIKPCIRRSHPLCFRTTQSYIFSFLKSTVNHIIQVILAALILPRVPNLIQLLPCLCVAVRTSNRFLVAFFFLALLPTMCVVNC